MEPIRDYDGPLSGVVFEEKEWNGSLLATLPEPSPEYVKKLLNSPIHFSSCYDTEESYLLRRYNHENKF